MSKENATDEQGRIFTYIQGEEEINLLDELVALYPKYPSCSFVLSVTGRVYSIVNKYSTYKKFYKILYIKIVSGFKKRNVRI